MNPFFNMLLRSLMGGMNCNPLMNMFNGNNNAVNNPLFNMLNMNNPNMRNSNMNNPNMRNSINSMVSQNPLLAMLMGTIMNNSNCNMMNMNANPFMNMLMQNQNNNTQANTQNFIGSNMNEGMQQLLSMFMNNQNRMKH